jgi:hypothetical protein
MTLYFLHKEQKMKVKIYNKPAKEVIVYTGRKQKTTGICGEEFEYKETATFPITAGKLFVEKDNGEKVFF